MAFSSSTNRPALLALTILAGITLTATALAQVGVTPPTDPMAPISTSDPYALTPVDQGTADLGDLNTSNRLIPIDLRQPLDFDHLYNAPDHSGRLMRVSGGLGAVFPRSEYAAGAGFTFPLIPAGTEFFIGPMPITAPASIPAGPDAISNVIDGRLDLAAVGMTTNRLEATAPAAIKRIHASVSPGITLEELLTGRANDDLTPEERAPAPSVWSSERYRRGRIAALLERALEHHRGS
jgi:hypothetical protein